MISTRIFMVNVDGWSWYGAGLKEISKDKTKIKANFETSLPLPETQKGTEILNITYVKFSAQVWNLANNWKIKLTDKVKRLASGN